MMKENSDTKLDIILNEAAKYFREEYLAHLPASTLYEVERVDGIKKGTVKCRSHDLI